MKKTLTYATLALALAAPVRAADASLMRNVFQSCAFGAGALAATTYVGLTPALATGMLTVPVTEVIAANAVVGCGVGAVGAAAATVTGWIYDAIF
jgi:hypothetical protein